MQIDIEKIQEAQAELEKLEQLEQLKSLMGGQVTELPFEVGKKYIIRTVTYHTIGEVLGIKGKFLIIKGAWLPDTGRWMQATEGNFDENLEVEPSKGNILLNTDTIVDAVEFDGEVPSKQK